MKALLAALGLFCAACGLHLEPTDSFSGKGPDCYDTKRSTTLYVGTGAIPLGSYDCTRDRYGNPKEKY